MKGVVWGSTFQIATKQLDEIVNSYNLCRIPTKKIMKSKNNYLVVFENGDIWRACGARENMRGIRANVSYIDHMISPIIVDEIIKPCTIAYPFQATHYYWPREDEENE